MRGAGERNVYDLRWYFAGGSGRGRERFDYPYGGRKNMHKAAGDQTKSGRKTFYDQTNNTPTNDRRIVEISKVEAFLAQ
jgi:hypothetical protein